MKIKNAILKATQITIAIVFFIYVIVVVMALGFVIANLGGLKCIKI